MPIPDTNGLPPFADFAMVVSKLNELVAKYNNLLVNLDTLNIIELNAKVITADSITGDKIQANTITADKMNVNQLSAISANLGHITAGLIETVTMIGSLIMTDEPGNYPRAEMSNTEKMFIAEKSATRRIEITPLTTLSGGGAPGVYIKHDSNELTFGYDATLLGGPGIYTNNSFDIQALGGVYLTKVMVPSWSLIEDYFAGRTLAQELSDITNAINGLTAALNNKANKSVSTSSSGSHNHGIEDGTVLMKYDGTPVTYHAAPAHSHTQN